MGYMGTVVPSLQYCYKFKTIIKETAQIVYIHRPKRSIAINIKNSEYFPVRLCSREIEGKK